MARQRKGSLKKAWYRIFGKPKPKEINYKLHWSMPEAVLQTYGHLSFRRGSVCNISNPPAGYASSWEEVTCKSCHRRRTSWWYIEGPPSAGKEKKLSGIPLEEDDGFAIDDLTELTEEADGEPKG